ncbi:hypothetical protein ABTI03_19220, partial [Acinetobacter baumannii]
MSILATLTILSLGLADTPQGVFHMSDKNGLADTPQGVFHMSDKNGLAVQAHSLSRVEIGPSASYILSREVVVKSTK